MLWCWVWLCVQVTVQLLETLTFKVGLLWSTAEYYGDLCPPLVAPLGHLAVACMQYLSVDMQQLQQSGVAPAAHHSLLLHSATDLAHNCVAGASMGINYAAPGVDHWLDLQPGRPDYLLQCACLASTIAALWGELPADMTATNSTTAGDSAAPADLWHRCCSMADAVPDVCTSMLRLLSCSKETMLWAAARDLSDDVDHIKSSVHMAHSTVEHVCAAQLQNPNSPQAWNKQAIEAALPLFWQLPAVALLWASQHPTGTKELDTQYMLACHNAVQVSAQVMYHSLRMQHFVNGYQLRPGEVSLIDEGGSRAPLPAVFLKVAQPLLCQILIQLLQLQRASVAQSSSGTSSTGSSLSAAIDRMPWTSNVVDVTGTFPKLALTAVVDAASNLLHMMVQHTMRPDAAPSSRQRHTVRQLCPVFEDVVRGQTEAFTAPSRSTDQLSVFTLLGLPGLLNGEIAGWQVGPLVDPITELAEPKALQLFGLLSSMMKVAGNRRMQQLLEAVQAAARQQQDQMPAGLSFNRSTAMQYAQVASYSACRVLGEVMLSCGLTAKDSQAATGMVPWLALLGRGSIHFSTGLQSLLAAAVRGQPSASGYTRSEGGNGMAACREFVGSYCGDLVHMTDCVEACLKSSSAAAHLVAAGYNLKPLLLQLERMPTALQAAAGASRSTGDQQCFAACKELSSQLTAFGHLLASLSHPYACNNPCCQALTGPSEVQLVIGRSTKCGACRTARYCCKACLKQHWQQHKPVCKGLAAAAAATAAAAGSGL